jgi:hypothetical protein
MPPELGADAGADTAGQQQRRHQRAGLLDHGDGQRLGDERLGAEALQRGAGVHRHHHADSQPGQPDQRRGAQAQRADLRNDLGDSKGEPEGVSQRTPAEDAHFAGLPEEISVEIPPSVFH